LEQNFIDGFRIGARMMTEVFQSQIPEESERKRDGGAIIYEIIDPEIRYAIKNKLEITRN